MPIVSFLKRKTSKRRYPGLVVRPTTPEGKAALAVLRLKNLRRLNRIRQCRHCGNLFYARLDRAVTDAEKFGNPQQSHALLAQRLPSVPTPVVLLRREEKVPVEPLSHARMAAAASP
jgi:hypothetical protein